MSRIRLILSNKLEIFLEVSIQYEFKPSAFVYILFLKTSIKSLDQPID